MLRLSSEVRVDGGDGGQDRPSATGSARERRTKDAYES